MLRKPLATQGEPVPYRFSVAEWHRLGEVLFDEDDRVELLEGEIILMHAIGYRHAQAVNNLNETFLEQARRRYMVAPQNPVWLDNMSEPQSDIVLVARTQRTAGHHPQPDAVFLVIEVADTSLQYDRRRKMRVYARAGVREFWIVNLEEDVIEAFYQPRSEDYAEQRIVRMGGSISPSAFPDVAVLLDEVIPARTPDK